MERLNAKDHKRVSSMDSFLQLLTGKLHQRLRFSSKSPLTHCTNYQTLYETSNPRLSVTFNKTCIKTNPPLVSNVLHDFCHTPEAAQALTETLSSLILISNAIVSLWLYSLNFHHKFDITTTIPLNMFVKTSCELKRGDKG